jgi:hypothetical protein
MFLKTAFQVSSFTKLAARWNILRRPVIEYIIGIGGSIAIGDCITFEEVSCCPVPPHYIKASVSQVQDFKLHYNGELLYVVNLFVFRDSDPAGVTYLGLSILPNDMYVFQTNILYAVPVGRILTTSLLVHHTRYTDAHYGYFRVYSVQYKTDVGTGIVELVPVNSLKASSQEIHRGTYPEYQSYPECVHHKCAQINLVVLLMLC